MNKFYIFPIKSQNDILFGHLSNKSRLQIMNITYLLAEVWQL